MNRGSTVMNENYYDYVAPPITLIRRELTQNDAYDLSIPGTLGVFTAPNVQPNAAYGVLQPHTTDNDGYVLTETLRSQGYEEPEYISLTTV